MSKQSGFSLIEGLLIVITVSVIGLGGFYVWNQNKTKEADQTDTKQTSESKPTEEKNEPAADVPELALSDSWKRYESGKNAFSIKLPDGLDGSRDTTRDFFIFKEYVSQDSPAKVSDVDGYGSDGFFALMIYADKTSNMYNSTDKLNEKIESFTTDAGVKGTKTTYDDPYEPQCGAIGCYLGDKHVLYDFPVDSTGETVRIWYARRVVNEETKKVYEIENEDPDYTKTIDEMVHSLKLN